MKVTKLQGSTDTTVKYGLVDESDKSILVIDQGCDPVYTNPIVTIHLPEPFSGPQAVDMFLKIMEIQDNKLSKMVARVGKKPK